MDPAAPDLHIRLYTERHVVPYLERHIRLYTDTQGRLNRDIAPEVGCHPATVGKWRSRFAAERLEGCMTRPAGQAPHIGDADVERVIVKTLEETPPDATHCYPRVPDLDLRHR